MNVAEYIAAFLVKNNVKHIFGYAGSAMLKILEEIMNTGKLEYHQNFHEQAASFCADAYARVSGMVGVALVTSGPGAVNSLAGIADAYFDSVPLIVISGQDYSHNILGDNGKVRQIGFQDLDIVSVASPITKYAKLISDPEEILYELEKAYHIATTGRKGPVLLDVPIDIQFKEMEESKLKHYEKATETISVQLKDIDLVYNTLQEAKRPVVLAGGGIRLASAEEELESFVQRTTIPVIATLNGVDAYYQKYGFSGLYGHTYANMALYNADTILVFGARIGQRQIGKIAEEYTQAKKIVQVDIDENELGRAVPKAIGVKADLKEFLTALNKRMDIGPNLGLKDWNICLNNKKKELYYRDEVNKEGLDPVRFIKEISEMIPENAVITADVGQNQMWVNQGLLLKKGQRVLNSSGYGSMGFSLPAGIGASYVQSKPVVLAFMGDGGFHMNMQELEYLKLHRPNVKCIVFNNNTLGMMREVQKRYYREHYYGSNIQDFQCPNLRLLAETYGLDYLYIEKQVDTVAFGKALENDKPYLIECRIQFDSELINRYDELQELPVNFA